MSEYINGNAAPVSAAERLTILDSLRGIAILGILLMNIPGFGLPSPVYGDLTVWNEIGTVNFDVWYTIEMTVAGTQRALFSILFGAGIILFIGKKENSLGGLMPAEYFFRRQLWLLVFGLFNAFVLLWFWDILFQYAICGMLLFAFRRLSPKALIIAAVVCLFFQMTRDNVEVYRMKNTVTVGEELAKRDTTQVKLSENEKEQLGAMQGLKERTTLEAKKKRAEASVRKMTGDYATLYKYQSERSYEGEVEYTYFGIWDILIFMFLGMAFFKNGIILGTAETKVYWLLCIGGLAVGGFLTWLRLQETIDLNFNGYEILKSTKIELYELARTIRSVGIFGLIMLLYKSGWFKWLFALLRPVGQMAFTNYLTQSLFMGLFFYGIGLGMFGKLQRYELYYVVAVVWVVQIIWSHVWLKFFQFGPLEWTWRSLTYWKIQPMKRS